MINIRLDARNTKHSMLQVYYDKHTSHDFFMEVLYSDNAQTFKLITNICPLMEIETNDL